MRNRDAPTIGNILVGDSLWYFVEPDWLRDTLEIELGEEVTFDLYHHDDVMFGDWF